MRRARLRQLLNLPRGLSVGGIPAPVTTLMMKFRSNPLIIALLLLLGVAGAARAGEADQCREQGGTYLTGRIVHGPFFVRARHYLHGVALSHTKIMLRGDDGQIYDIRADNVFAAGYDQALDAVPAPLSGLHPGDLLALCGKPYETRAGQRGMDWVHTNCGAPPRASAPNGWLELVGPGMISGPNLEASSEYCHLW